jgi:hypothetical protein
MGQLINRETSSAQNGNLEVPLYFLNEMPSEKISLCRVWTIKLRVNNMHAVTPPRTKPTVVVEWLKFLLRIREDAGSNLGPETGYPELSRDLPQSL